MDKFVNDNKAIQVPLIVIFNSTIDSDSSYGPATFATLVYFITLLCFHETGKRVAY